MTEEEKKTQFNAMASVLVGTLLSRLNTFNQAGLQYGTSRDIYEACGYDKYPTYNVFMSRYLRQDIAKAIINRPVKATWKGGVKIVESDDDKETALEKAWVDMYKNFKLHSIFTRLDTLSSIGQYGVLLIGLNDVQKKEDMAKPVSKNRGLKLTYLKPLGEGSAKVNKWESGTKSERYGLPVEYQLTINQPGGTVQSNLNVHHSRVIHVTGEKIESEVDGVPVLEAVLNRLFDLEKIVGGSAEMFWEGARPGYLGKIKDDYQVPADVMDGMQDQLDEFYHKLRRVFIGEGIEDLKALAQQIVSPKEHIEAQIEMISAVTGIPKRILTGSERGELASSEDKNTWLDLISARREEYAETNIVRPFIDTMVNFGILPQAIEEYSVMWRDLWAPSEMDKAELGKKRSESLKAYASEPLAAEIIPHESFMRNFLGMSDEEVEIIMEERKQALLDEENEMEEEEPEETEEEPEQQE